MSQTYLPIFNYDTTNLKDRWILIRKFIEAWHQISINNKDKSNQILEIEQKLGFDLPLSFRDYIDTSLQLLDTNYTYQNGQKTTAFSKVFRDKFDVEDLGKHDAVTIMLQGEEDFYWGVKKSDLHLDDPKVYGYVINYDATTNDNFEFIGELYQSITSFVINHLFSFLQTKDSSGFGLHFYDIESIYSSLKSSFESHSRFNETEIFESENILAFIQKDLFEPKTSNEHTFEFHIHNVNQKYHIPESILELAKKREWYYGNIF